MNNRVRTWGIMHSLVSMKDGALLKYATTMSI